MREHIKKDDLKVGAEVFISTGEKLKVAKIENNLAKMSNGWEVYVRTDGFWGADASTGYLERENSFTPKFAVAWNIRSKPDPIQYYTTLDAARKKINELVVMPDVIKESIMLLHISKVQTVVINHTLKEMGD